MSASLVGSEMCIRDSPTLGVGEEPAFELQPSSAQARPPSLVIEDRPRPVSYTHLTLPTICSV
eukprot:3477212-Alexandrium_andersonii.AAC.1